MSDLAPGVAEPELAPAAFKPGAASIVWTVGFAIVLAANVAGWIFLIITGVTMALDPGGPAQQQLEERAQGLSRGDLWSETLFSFFLVGVAPLVWIVMTRVQAREGTLRYLQVTEPQRNLLRGVGLGLAVLAGVFVLRIVQLAATGQLDDAFSDNGTADQSPLIEAFARTMTWPLAVAISFVAAFGEEILFRGILQKWIGWIGSAVVFGLAHAGYGTVEQIVVPLAIGLLFGYLYKRGASIVFLMAAHFTYDFVQLALLVAVS